MDKETLSNYGWIVIAVLVLAVMVALASPFGHFIENGVKSTAQGLFDVEQKAMGVAGLTLSNQNFNDQGVVYTMLEGSNSTITSNTDTKFCSSADYSKFESVKVDSNTVEPSNYTVTEGSTIVTLNGEYLATLPNGTHTLAIVSNDGCASCEFVVDIEAKPEFALQFGEKYNFLFEEQLVSLLFNETGGGEMYVDNELVEPAIDGTFTYTADGIFYTDTGELFATFPYKEYSIGIQDAILIEDCIAIRGNPIPIMWGKTYIDEQDGSTCIITGIDIKRVYDTMYLPLLYLFHHSEKIRSFKVLTTPTVITELGDFPTAELGMTADEVLQKSSLIGYTFGLGFTGIL